MIERNRELSEMYAVALLMLWRPEGVITMGNPNKNTLMILGE